MFLRWTMRAVCLAAIALPVFAADTLDGKMITLEAGDQMSVDVPVSIPFDGAIGAGEVIHVVEPKTAKVFPATLRDGQLTFVPEGAMPKTEHLYTVKVDKDVRPPHVQMKKHDNENAIDVVIDDVLFTTYHYEKEARKPYLWPVLSNGDVKVTRDYPMGEGLMTKDHPHHRSFWSAYGNVNGADCWMEEDKAGWQETNDVTYGSGDAYGWIVAKNTWTDVEHKPVCKEEREYRFYTSQKDARLVDVKVTFSPIDADVKFGDTKEGGIVSFRMNDQMTEKETYSVVDKGTGKVLGMYDVRKEADEAVAKQAGSEVKVRPKGVITNAEGKTGMANTWGKPSPWCDYSGTVDGAGVHGITVFDNPANLRYPTTWHVRDYGLMGANPFGLSYFTNKEKNGDYTIAKGDKLTFNYRVYVHIGDAQASKVADRYADYINPPKISFAK